MYLEILVNCSLVYLLSLRKVWRPILMAKCVNFTTIRYHLANLCLEWYFCVQETFIVVLAPRHSTTAITRISSQNSTNERESSLTFTWDGTMNFPTGLTLPKTGLKCCFWDTFAAKNLWKIVVHLPTGGLATVAIVPSSPPLAPPLTFTMYHIFSRSC